MKKYMSMSIKKFFMILFLFIFLPFSSIFAFTWTEDEIRQISGGDIWNDNEWHFICGTYDGTSSDDSIEVYVDSVVVAKSSGDTLSASTDSVPGIKLDQE